MIKKLYLHGGIFHADDVAVAAMMQFVNPAIEIRRVNKVPNNLSDEDVMVADIGGGKYDHHQKDVPIRKDGFKHSAASLVWQDYGPEIVRLMFPLHNLSGNDIAVIVGRFDAQVLRSIAAMDNGHSVSTTDFENHVLGGEDVVSLSSLVSQFNPNWDSPFPVDACFFQAVNFVKEIFRRTLSRMASSFAANALVRQYLKASNDVRILVMDQYIPWQGEVVKNSPETLMVIFPSLRGGYNLQLVPEKLGCRETKTHFPVEWMSGRMPAGATFVHQSGFMAAFDTKNAALCAAQSVLAVK